jgi:hypothetical protein
VLETTCNGWRNLAGDAPGLFGSALGLGLGTKAGDGAEMAGVEPASENSP